MSRSDVERGFDRAASEPTDMIEHMSVIRDYSSRCRTTTEFGVYDCTSTWALAAGFPERLTSYDIDRRVEVSDVEDACRDSGVEFRFVLGDTAVVEIEKTDLLFVDSLHTYDHTKKELARHADKVSKYMLFHDTVTWGHKDQPGFTGPGIWLAILEFLESTNEWQIEQHFDNCHGLTVLKRI